MMDATPAPLDLHTASESQRDAAQAEFNRRVIEFMVAQVKLNESVERGIKLALETYLASRPGKKA